MGTQDTVSKYSADGINIYKNIGVSGTYAIGFMEVSNCIDVLVQRKKRSKWKTETTVSNKVESFPDYKKVLAPVPQKTNADRRYNPININQRQFKLFSLSEISQITFEDTTLYRRFTDKLLDEEKRLRAYSLGWNYITQASRRNDKGDLGWKYISPGQDALITLTQHRGRLVAINPLGNFTPYLKKLVEIFRTESTRPIFIKKLSDLDQEWVQKELGASHTSKMAWSNEAKDDDDTFPEVILELENSMNYKAPNVELSNLRGRISKFKSLGLTVDLLHPPFGLEFLKKISLYIRDYFIMSGVSLGKATNNANAYSQMLKGLVHYNMQDEVECFVATIDTSIVGFYLAEKITPRVAALYASIANRDYENAKLKYPGINEFLYLTLMKRLCEKGIKHLNLGGSELESLHKFKQKFAPIGETKVPILVITT